MESFDLIIVGAGITGAMIAHRAREAHAGWRILLLERSLGARAATQYSGGHNHPHGLSPAQRALAAESIAYWDQLCVRMPDLPLYERSMFAVVSEARLEETVQGYVRPGMRRAGPREEAQLRETFSDLRIAPGQALITGARGGQGAPPAIAERLIARFAAGARASYYEGTELAAAEADGDGQRLHTTDGRAFASRRLVIAPGASFARFSSFIPGKLRIKKVVALHVHRAPRPNDPILYFFDDDAYLLPALDREQWILSFPSREWDCPPDQSALAIDAGDRALALSILSKYAPSLAAVCHGGRVSCDAYSEDRLPLVAPIPALGSAVFAGAGSGYGFRLAPAVASRALALCERSLHVSAAI